VIKKKCLWSKINNERNKCNSLELLKNKKQKNRFQNEKLDRKTKSQKKRVVDMKAASKKNNTKSGVKKVIDKKAEKTTARKKSNPRPGAKKVVEKKVVEKKVENVKMPAERKKVASKAKTSSKKKAEKTEAIKKSNTRSGAKKVVEKKVENADKMPTAKTGSKKKAEKTEAIKKSNTRSGAKKVVEKKVENADKMPTAKTGSKKKAEKAANEAKTTRLPSLPDDILLKISQFTPASLGPLQLALGKAKSNSIQPLIKKNQRSLTDSAIKERDDDHNYNFGLWWKYAKETDDDERLTDEDRLGKLYQALLSMKQLEKVNDVKLKKIALSDVNKRIKKAKRLVDPDMAKEILDLVQDG
jgi:hypothetical protein